MKNKNDSNRFLNFKKIIYYLLATLSIVGIVCSGPVIMSCVLGLAVIFHELNRYVLLGVSILTGMSILMFAYMAKIITFSSNKTMEIAGLFFLWMITASIVCVPILSLLKIVTIPLPQLEKFLLFGMGGGAAFLVLGMISSIILLASKNCGKLPTEKNPDGQTVSKESLVNNKAMTSSININQDENISNRGTEPDSQL